MGLSGERGRAGSPKNIPSERLESLGTIFGNFIFGRIAPFLDPKNGMDDAPEFTLHVLGPDLGSSHDSRKDGQGILRQGVSNIGG